MHFDAAFVPLDPRQGNHYADGILYFLKNVDCNVIFPMHYWNDANVIKRFITEYPQYTIDAIAKMCGIDSRQHFHRLFSEYFGITPSAFRKNHLSSDNKDIKQ